MLVMAVIFWLYILSIINIDIKDDNFYIQFFLGKGLSLVYNYFEEPQNKYICEIKIIFCYKLIPNNADLTFMEKISKKNQFVLVLFIEYPS